MLSISRMQAIPEIFLLPPDAGGRGDALGRTKPGRGHIYYERDDVDAEIEVEDDLFPDTDDEEEEF